VLGFPPYGLRAMKETTLDVIPGKTVLAAFWAAVSKSMKIVVVANLL
jgi:hypothetical protein